MTRVRSAIDAALADRDGRPTDRRFRGSLLGGCLRAQVYAANGRIESNPPDERSLRVFERGHVTARQLVELLERSPKVSYIEVETHAYLDEYDFAVNVDAVVGWWDGRKEVLEFKSTHGNGMRFVENAPKPEHAIQTAAGRLAIERKYQNTADYAARLVYVSADDWRIYEHEIGREWDERALRVLRALRYFDSRDRMPPRLPTPKDKYPCSWCAYRDVCKRD